MVSVECIEGESVITGWINGGDGEAGERKSKVERAGENLLGFFFRTTRSSVCVWIYIIRCSWAKRVKGFFWDLMEGCKSDFNERSL